MELSSREDCSPFKRTCTKLASATVLLSLHVLFAQSTAPPAKFDADVLIFNDGEKLIGTLERSSGASVVFKSNMAGEITVDWSKIKEIHSSRRFAVAEKGMTFGRRHQDLNKVPQGTLSMTDQTLQVQDAPDLPPERIPVSNAAYVIDDATFEKAFEKPSLLDYWTGAANFGASLVLATQNDRSYTSNVALVRTIPGDNWRELENKTLINFSNSYGSLSQPNEPKVRTSIYHANVERDEYFKDTLFVFVGATFDHNYSQGLDLQQSYGSGIGWTVLKHRNDEFDLKAEATYVDQQFSNAPQNQELFGSIFGEVYNHKFRRNVLFTEQLSISPSWNNLTAYSSTGNVSLSIPVLERVGLTLGSLDTFLNNPSMGFKKNSFQFTTSATYIFP